VAVLVAVKVMLGVGDIAPRVGVAVLVFERECVTVAVFVAVPV